MSLVDLNFPAFAPDMPALNSPGLVRAHNCSAGLGSTQGGVTLFPLKSASLYSNTSMESAPLGSAIGQDRFGNARVYAGSAAHLYRLSPVDRQWTAMSRTAGYNTTGTERWKSCEFGAMQIFTNYNDEPQTVDMNANVQFSNLTTLCKFRHIATFKGFVIGGYTYDALDGAVNYRVRWSGLEAPTDWTFSPATQADFQDVMGFGAVQGIVTDDSCYVLLQRGIVQMTYVGAPYIFQFTDRVTGKGCSIPESVITVAGMHFFVSDDGFYQLAGGQLTPIGQGKIDKYFLDTFDASQAHRMTVAADPRETLIYWQYATEDAEDGKPNMVLIYNYVTGSWTTADATADFIFNSVSLPWTLDQLDTFVSIDLIPASLDSPIWSGGRNMLWSMSRTGAVYSFGGPTMELQLETPEFQISRNIPNETGADLAIVDGVRPLFEGDAVARIQIGTRKLPNADLDWSEMKEVNPITGFAYTRNASRYQRVRLRLSGDWTKAFGLQIDAKAAGRR